MNHLTCDYIAIDTNVFEHLLNPKKNNDDHIEKLLKTLAEDEVNLIVDEDRRIENEYEHRIKPMFKNTSDENIQNLLLLQFWIESHIDERKRVSVSHNDQLMTAIKGVITENEAVDSIFVYVAFTCDRIFITNDRSHIIKGSPRENPERRKTLLQKTRKFRPNKKSEILSSIEAEARL